MKRAKYIFITGGVVSSLGKGITAASIGYLLQACGLKVNIIKFDPYLNVDPGTMSPYQHGEVFVTEDGAETDLDIGHYERFLNVNLTKDNNVTAGQIYDAVITKERAGVYLGKTIQVIPHITDEIKYRIKKVEKNFDVVIVEIGGTVGDIESLPFLEAIRQLKQDIGKDNVCYIHLTLVPYIKAADELKTKPTQHSVGKLREIGIQPDILICRTERKLNNEIKSKISLFCNVSLDSVIEEIDVGDCIYKVPIILKEQNLHKLILNHLKLNSKKQNFNQIYEIIKNHERIKEKVTIALAGKYTELKDAYKSVYEALFHAALANNVRLDIKYVDVESKDIETDLSSVQGILIPGGVGERGVEAKISIAGYARKNRIAFFGICLGMQCAIIEFARNCCNLKNANSKEFDPNTRYPVIDILPEQKNVKDKGGTMRLGSYPCKIVDKNSFAYKSYKKSLVYERHRHRYEFNNKFMKLFMSKGMKFTGFYEERNLVEIIELQDSNWFVGVQFHPEFKSRISNPHPLFYEFIKAAKSCHRV